MAVLYIHIVTACVAIVTGWIPWFRKPSGGRSTLRHRRLGVIYAASVLLSGGGLAFTCLSWLAGAGSPGPGF
ncbi:DUF2306 domain-containing protein [Paenibacillus filicis]|uniref:DUF2306 domain-containing protein n=1 Tax=Paenibacillus filicis TaxID=669464 RepID=A0ABU9DVR3_9BACL